MGISLGEICLNYEANIGSGFVMSHKVVR
jgi:hypothetical protein